MNDKTPDAIDMLTADHDKVKSLFKQFEDLGQRAFTSKKKIADQICDALTLHTKIEEKLFYPAVRAAIGNEELMDEAKVEHAAAKQLITQISSMDPGDDLYDAKLKVLSEQVAHHIEEEEGEIFPAARDSELDLNELGAKMQALQEKLKAEAG
jgi:hemerythrin-like domain-containing protein